MSNMAMEIVAFILNISGWILVCSTLPTDYWKVSSVDGTVITTATFWSNLWKTCVTDSTGVSNCKDFPSMLALDVYIQVCRGLMIASVCLGFFGATLALMGMKCTRIGGSESTKARLTGLSGLHFILNGLCSLTACSLYAHRITSEFFDPLFFAQNRAECSYSGGTSMVTKRHKPGKSANSFYKSPVSTDPRDPAEHSRQFGKNAYV
uniref:Claudin n=1 Tax=Oncorhynchus tshawytscha TaxID=74940 RepID=A0A8C8GZ00_ONCTS